VSDTDLEASLDKFLDNQRRGLAIVFNAEDLFARFRHAAAPLRQRTSILGNIALKSKNFVESGSPFWHSSL
jgi:hypothetical protein